VRKADTAAAPPGEPSLPPVPAAKIDFAAADRAWIAARIEEVLETGQLTLGTYGKQFEEEFARRCGAFQAIAVNSGTAALEIILRALDVRGRDVLVPANTFFATAAAAINAGARPILMDTDPTTLGTALAEIERRLTADTAAVIVVHVGGLITPEMPEIEAFCRQRGVALVEDAAHAHGSRLAGKHAGTFGIAGAFSFYPTKVMTAGEGGMIVTDDPRIDAEARIYRDQGKASFTQNAHVRLGYNWRLSEPHAIIGLRHLQRLDGMVAARRRIAAIYDRALADAGRVRPIPVPEACFCNYYKYMAILPEGVERTLVKRRLCEEYKVSLSGEVYELPLHRNPVFADLGRGDLRAAEAVCSRHICLPVFASMTADQAGRVVEALSQVVG
jgi:dTDP-4-amino-4,6-dideoxygalactose transaminase